MNETNGDGAPELNHRQAKSIAMANRIYAEWKANLQRAAGLGAGVTWPQVLQLLDAAIRCCMDHIPDETIRRQCIDRFTDMRTKVQQQAEQDLKANLAKLTGDACVKCGALFGEGQPKIWIADGQYVCAKCQ